MSWVTIFPAAVEVQMPSMRWVSVPFKQKSLILSGGTPTTRDGLDSTENSCRDLKRVDGSDSGTRLTSQGPKNDLVLVWL